MLYIVFNFINKESAKVIKLSLKNAAEILSAKIINDTHDSQFNGISTDTRTIQPGNLFVALKGEKFDAHDFIDQAVQKGAVAVLVQRQINSPVPQLIVADTLSSLGKLAKSWRSQFNIPFIALTGSNGKTTTKNMLGAIFLQANHNQSDAILFTQGNLNNDIGLPLTLSRLAPTHRTAIIEMGMNHFGELDYLSRLTEPTTALITNIATAHLEGVGGNIEGVAKAKAEIFNGLQNDGIAIINADDNFAEYLRKLAGSHRCVSFGLKNHADVSVEILPPNNPETTQLQTLFRLTYQNQSIEILLNLPGEHNVMNALAASAAALANNVSLSDIKTALEKIQAAPGRLQFKVGQQGLRIIDDTYNANPASLRAAMYTLVNNHQGTKILVLGDMRELGPDGEKLHFESGQLAQQLGINYLFATGTLSKAAVKAFGNNAFHFADHEHLINALKQRQLDEKVVMLVKGSRSMRMEQVVQALAVQNVASHS